MVKERLQSDYEKLKLDEVEREKRIKELSGLSEKREQAKSDLKGGHFFLYLPENNFIGTIFCVVSPFAR